MVFSLLQTIYQLYSIPENSAFVKSSVEDFKFEFIGLFRAPSAKELEGVGQQPSLESIKLIRGGGKKLRRLRWFFSPAQGCLELL
jgi:hypothetical protein